MTPIAMPAFAPPESPEVVLMGCAALAVLLLAADELIVDLGIEDESGLMEVCAETPGLLSSVDDCVGPRNVAKLLYAWATVLQNSPFKLSHTEADAYFATPLAKMLYSFDLTNLLDLTDNWPRPWNPYCCTNRWIWAAMVLCRWIV